jgi:hypothetical protein
LIQSLLAASCRSGTQAIVVRIHPVRVKPQPTPQPVRGRSDASRSQLGRCRTSFRALGPIWDPYSGAESRRG